MSNWLEREELLLGKEAVSTLQKANLLAVGLGGVGGIAVEMIVRGGVGSLTIVDGDIVEESNRNRQIIALTSTVGRNKAEVLAERLLAINPELKLNIRTDFLKEEDMEELVQSGSFDCVLDAIDTLAPKISLIKAAVKRGIPVVSSMGSGAHIDPEKIACVPVMKTFNCPLSKAVRKGLRGMSAEDLKLCRAVFTSEDPVEDAVVDTHSLANNKRAMQGTISYMPALFRCHCAAEVIRILRGGTV